ncbi:MAG: hypothetical protein IT435_17170 [Phycisphaerales bacterium]|nr:hypothetical protein [Phycisphaerales bacterium]
MHPLQAPITLMGLALGAVLIANACWILWSPNAQARFNRLSSPSRATLGFSLLLAGYHLLGYSTPDTWFPIKIPRERWFILPIGIAIALTFSLFLDARQGVSRNRNDDPGASSP